jgi:hypothetical protein
MRWWARALAIIAVAALTAASLWWTVHGGGLTALWPALAGWAALTALASGVVRTLRLRQAVAPAPPVAAATLGAACAGLLLGDPGDVKGLAVRLAVFVIAASGLLVLLQSRIDESPRASSCRAGLFDCSLPAWPSGAWRDPWQWPMLLAALAMLPMMAALPLMAAWCTGTGIAPQFLVFVHLAAMFGPALLLQAWMTRWPQHTLAIVCAALLVTGAALAAWAAAPVNLLGPAVAQGAAWGLAWSGQLWAPARRGRQGTSPLRAAAGYAVLTLAFGWAVEQAGARGVAAVHVTLGLAVVLAGVLATTAAWVRAIAARKHLGH